MPAQYSHAATHEYIEWTKISLKKGLRQIEQRERDGWELYSILPYTFHIFGSGGTCGYRIVMRQRVRSENPTETPE